MSALSQLCERAYQRGQAGRIQIRTASGRLIRSADAVEALAGCISGRMADAGTAAYRRVVDVGTPRWLEVHP